MKNDIFPSIKIRPIAEEDFNTVLGWRQDEDFCKANDWESNRREELWEWWLNCVNNTSEDFLRLGIECNEKLIGYIDLSSIKGNTAELGIAIGDSGLWGKGIGQHAALLAMDYGSESLGITAFDAETHQDNLRSRKMLEKLGFKEISREGFEEYQGRKNRLIQYELVL